MLTKTIHRIEDAEELDDAVDALTRAADTVIPPGPVRETLHGKQLGHALHPLVIVAPIGLNLAASLLDLAGDDGDHAAARRLTGMALLASAPAAASGMADLAGLRSPGPAAAQAGDGPLPPARPDEPEEEDTVRGARRIGLVHAGINAATSAVFAASWLARRAGHHRCGAALSLAGLAGLGAGGYLGGHLAYNRGVGVTRGEGAEVAQI